MKELKPSQFTGVIPLLHLENVHCTFAYAVAEGKQPGKIYVDEKTVPESCLIVCRSGKYLVAGASDNSHFNEFLKDFLLNKENHNSYFDLYSSSKSWLVKIDEMLGERAAKLSRKLYHWDHSRPFSFPDTPDMLPEAFQLIIMDEALFERYVKEMDSSYGDLWISAENFLSKGFGFCIVKNQDLVSACNTYYVSEGRAEIDIATKEAYRRMGFASVTCRAFIHHCLQQGIEPIWDCDNGNTYSKVLAEKLGFRGVETYEMHWWHENSAFVESYLKKFSYSGS